MSLFQGTKNTNTIGLNKSIKTTHLNIIVADKIFVSFSIAGPSQKWFQLIDYCRPHKWITNLSNNLVMVLTCSASLTLACLCFIRIWLWKSKIFLGNHQSMFVACFLDLLYLSRVRRAETCVQNTWTTQNFCFAELKLPFFLVFRSEWRFCST